MMSYHPAPPRPCSECPWVRKSANGWIGPYTAEEWVKLAFSDKPIACHETIKVDGHWTDGVKQCKGAAIYRRNICKLPRDSSDAAHAAKPDRSLVFGSPKEFLDHHDAA